MSVTKGYMSKAFYGDKATIAESTTWTAFAGVTKITPPKPSAAKIDTTNFESSDEFKETEAGLGEVSDVELEIQYDATQADAVYKLFRQKKAFRVQFADGSKWEFVGFISEYGDEIDREGIVSTTVNIAVSGKPVFTKAGAPQA